ncbi:hypothetical protein F511_39252 [Dorcoceras hygrometricum]|uniref:Uncharacterized protein n=1 Tax=Dorcoceras hygrometricum TaxID=472368 RepID=A0A2Z7D6S1_9LAMI|nr:hypothetical protein F511_39252 [Dorcoceras hygrometricum]
MNEVRNKRLAQSRMQVIVTEISKLKACIQQVEQLNPIGSSEMDIMIRAKELMKQDYNFKKGFKFDLMVNYERYGEIYSFLKPVKESNSKEC